MPRVPRQHPASRCASATRPSSRTCRTTSASRRGNVILKTRPRDVEETLPQLINDDDPAAAAAAIDVVREAKIWSLADDVEHGIAHRDVKDWYVFEAASWALAEQRMPAERRREFSLSHRQPQSLRAESGGSRLSSVGQRRRVVPDRRRVAPGPSRDRQRPRPGRIRALEHSHTARWPVTVSSRDSGQSSTIDAPAALAFYEAMAGLGMPVTIRTLGSAVTLAPTVDELRTLLADNTDLVSGLFATLAEDTTNRRASSIPRRRPRELGQLADGGLTAIDRVFALQYVPLFRRVSAEEMRHLAMVAAPVTMKEGSVLFPESAPPALWLLLTGEVVLASSTGQPPETARGGDAIGALSTMAGKSLGRTATVVKGGVALKIDREDLFDVLGERPELLRQMFASLFRRERPVAATPAAAAR